MNRISTNMPNDNLQYHTRKQQVELNRSQNRMAAQTKILNLRDDPAAAGHATRYQSYLHRLNRYSDNIEVSMGQYRITEGHMRHAVDILQEIRQLAVRGANNVFGPDQLKTIGTEVNELFNEFINTANAVDGEGSSVFAGNRINHSAYRVINGRQPGVAESVVQQVEYLGDIGTRQVEIADGKYVELNFPGNSVFWAERQQVYAPGDARDYVVPQDSVITVNGENINLSEGDNVYQIITRINAAAAGTRASLDPVTNGLVLETTVARQLWIADEEGSVLQSLGIVNDQRPPHNLTQDTRVFGGSAFDAIINLRDSLYQNDPLTVGGSGLRNIDSVLSNVLSNLGSLGAKSNRLDIAFRRTEKEIEDVTTNSSTLTDLDFTEALTEFSALELTYRATLSVSADVIQPTLLDFLR